MVGENMIRNVFLCGVVIGVLVAVLVGGFFTSHVAQANESTKPVATSVAAPVVEVAPIKSEPVVVAPEPPVAVVEAAKADSASRYQFVRVTIMIAVVNPDFSNSLRKRVENLCDLVKTAPVIKDIEIEKMEGSTDQKDFFLFE
jgi:hypothetical protein